MILEPYQLEKYSAMMAERIIEISKEDHLIHDYMIYQCKHCGNIYVMWLEKGLEDPMDDQKTGKHKPVPFGITCPFCGGVVMHTLWSPYDKNISENCYKSYRKYVDRENRPIYRNFFWNCPTADCGLPVIFEPDYHSIFHPKENYRIYSEIYINTLLDKEYEEIMNRRKPFGWADVEDPTLSLNPAEKILEETINREERRHDILGKDGYKRPRSNKKLYEY